MVDVRRPVNLEVTMPLGWADDVRLEALAIIRASGMTGPPPDSSWFIPVLRRAIQNVNRRRQWRTRVVP